MLFIHLCSIHILHLKMNTSRGKNVINFSQSRQSSSTLQMHNFMPMPSPSLHVDRHQSEGRAYFENQLKQNLQSFWRERLSEICEAPTDVRSPHTLPLARIKKVMKSDEKVKMISADTPVIFAKACEMFVMELTIRAWTHTQHNKRKTVQRNDVALAVRDEHLLAFLNDMVPMESHHHHHHHLFHQDRDISNNDNDDGGVYVPHPPMYMNNGSGFGRRNVGMQYNSSFTSDDGVNPYISFKEFFQ